MTINAKTLFDPSLEKDNCGFGLIAQRNGKRSRKLVKKSILGLTSMIMLVSPKIDFFTNFLDLLPFL